MNTGSQFCIACGGELTGQSWWTGEAGPYCDSCWERLPYGAFTVSAPLSQGNATVKTAGGESGPNTFPKDNPMPGCAKLLHPLKDRLSYHALLLKGENREADAEIRLALDHLWNAIRLYEATPG